MTKECDHTSVGMIVREEDKILLIERMKFPFGFAPPAGHLDGDTYEEAARRELKEEVGLIANKLALIYEGRVENPCRREDGTFHDWKVYKAEASGEVKRSKDETKRVGWYSSQEIEKLMERTKSYLRGEITEAEWESSPGMEVFWYELQNENPTLF
jgi:ADP-ribose pyrophosphatase YjhB (NUDIX family)